MQPLTVLQIFQACQGHQDTRETRDSLAHQVYFDAITFLSAYSPLLAHGQVLLDLRVRQLDRLSQIRVAGQQRLERMYITASIIQWAMYIGLINPMMYTLIQIEDNDLRMSDIGRHD